MTWGRGWLLAVLLAISARSAGAQSGYPLQLSATGSRFLEISRTTVINRTLGGELRRTVLRSMLYTLRFRGDTLLIKADSVALEERTTGDPIRIDTDGFVGGHWKVLVLSDGRLRVLSRPYVPGSVAEVSDLSRAVDDFLPLLPPRLLPDSALSQADRRWQRQTDSAGRQRYRWRVEGRMDSTTVMPDSLRMEMRQDRSEQGWMLWSSTDGPWSWHRQITVSSTARIDRQATIVAIEQRLDVTRLD